ncbi:uncharacterized protein H6S33_001645 [Morchella sextelata]|uniref:uncharacterized protein n=1 Tax=Morchella sextelata TaxID=1174677 RepID=UPI001D048C34|nr:uncharacterized protein H6S33_001645 [Morchella sextelata]KAH0608511.1 hypothetical protein H6S33_001645 [Morchella sextelata]
MFNQVSIETGVDTPSNTANLMDATNTCAKGGLTPRTHITYLPRERGYLTFQPGDLVKGNVQDASKSQIPKLFDKTKAKNSIVQSSIRIRDSVTLKLLLLGIGYFED